MTVEITLALDDRDITRGLHEGNIEPEGIDLNTIISRPPPKRHRRMIQDQEFDACEMSLGSYLPSRTSSNDYPFTAIPVFPNRRFRHSFMFKNAEAGIEEPADLEGKDVATQTWQTTASLWMRGTLQEHYGVDLKSINWYTERSDVEDVTFSIPDRYNIQELPAAKGAVEKGRGDAENLLIEGQMDAALDPRLYSSVREENSNVERLFENYVEEEQEYYRQTGIYPLMHTVVIRDEVLEEYPWVARNLYTAFEEARDRCLKRLKSPGRHTTLTWINAHYESQKAVLGENPFPNGFADQNVIALEKLIEYADHQGLIPHQYSLDDIFVENSLWTPDLD